MPSRTPANSLKDEGIPLSTFDESTKVSVAGQDNHMSQTTLPTTNEPLSIIPPHPQGIKPSGQVYLATENIKTAAGRLFSLPDEIIVQVFENLDIPSLLEVGLTCKALWAFSRLEESLWRTRFIKYDISFFALFLYIFSTFV